MSTNPEVSAEVLGLLVLKSRLTEREKIQLRSATAGSLLWLYQERYRTELGCKTEDEGFAAMRSIQEALLVEYASVSKQDGFGNTWLF